MRDYQESEYRTDRQTADKVIPMCHYASQATQKVYRLTPPPPNYVATATPKLNNLMVFKQKQFWLVLLSLLSARWFGVNVTGVPNPRSTFTALSLKTKKCAHLGVYWRNLDLPSSFYGIKMNLYCLMIDLDYYLFILSLASLLTYIVDNLHSNA